MGDRPALAWQEGTVWKQWSYASLVRRARQVSRHLGSLGIRPGEAVGVIATRQPDVIAALIGILGAGGHYLPLDPAYPDARLRLLCEDSQLRFILSASTLADAERYPASVQTISDVIVGREDEDPLPVIGVSGGTPAYVMFTSGSTGMPKGVVVPHRAIIRLVDGPNFMRLDATRKFLHLSPLSFDASTLEIWGPLLNGGQCVLYPDQQLPTASGLRSVIRDTGVNSVWLTASLFNSVIDQDAASLEGVEELLVGGEALSVPHVRKAISALRDTQLINGYGPTENTTFTACHRIPRDLSDIEQRIPIGTPITGTSVVIVDELLQPVVAGVEGELVALGSGLAAGYLNKPELTAERFIQVALPDGTTQRGYRTGDRVVQRTDGLIDYLGRFDDQVKIEGHRIEPGEIERTIMRLPGIRDCRVLVRTGAAGQKRLAAYVATSSGDPIRTTLRQELAAKLPAFMVPHYMFFLEALPTNANGKLDKDALPDPFKQPTPAVPALLSGIAGLVARAWGEILNRPATSEEVNFFDAGGTSLEAVQLQELISTLCDQPLEPTFVFEYPTIKREVEALNSMKSVDSSALGRGQQRRSASMRRGRGVIS